MDAQALPTASDRLARARRGVDRAFIVLTAYALLVSVCMLTGLGGPAVSHYLGLVSDLPANLGSAILLAVAAWHTPRGTARAAWAALTITVALYFVGSSIASFSWFRDVDPFPGPADVFFCAFNLATLVTAGLLIRTAAVRVAWLQLTLDAAIFAVGFGAFFWYLVIRPAAIEAPIDSLKQLLSQGYTTMDCVALLMLGVVLLTDAQRASDRRISKLVMSGFGILFLGDIFWSLAKIRGYYLPGGLADVAYLLCHIPFGAAARAQLRALQLPRPEAAEAGAGLSRALPYAAMLASLLVLVVLTRGEIAGPATAMTLVVFALMLLLMIRQSVMLKGEAALRERRAARLVERRYASLIANASDVIVVVAPSGTLRFASPAARRTFGVEPERLIGRDLQDLWVGEDRARWAKFLSDVSASVGETLGPIEVHIERGDELHVLECVGSNLTADPAVDGLSLNFRDISDRKALEEKLRKQAFHDPLTLLANRNLFRDRVQHALALSQDSAAPVAVLFLDLDNFKNINDSLGHDAGDRLLQAVAQRIVKHTRQSDTVARLGGDELAILLEGGANFADVERIAQGLIQAMAQPFSLNGMEMAVTASIGIAFSTADSTSETLLGNADIAMYHAKAAGKNQHALFQPHMQDVVHERLRFEADIVRALARHEFLLHYQPIVDLGTGSLLGVEALVRWQHPEAGLLMPGRFVQIAEECGQIGTLGRWVLKQSCDALCAWREQIAGGHDLRIAVNISGRHLQNGELVRDVADALEGSGLEPGNLVIELTESVIMYNTEANLRTLDQLKKLGVRLAIDDFGTGYSSLSYLHRFPIDILKIDRSFVSRLGNSDEGSELARAVITLGETLGLDTVAEGIESDSQVSALLSLGCVAGQGFLFASPSSLEQITHSRFVARRAQLWQPPAALENLSATGRFRALRELRRQAT
jgi:diguanylate cyclase (GGDEF)-like protein/PAS domain S-box-containing protein